MDSLVALTRLGQSIWLDNLSRDLLDTGTLARLIDQGVSGLTSNPTIFAKAIAGNIRYAEDLARARRLDAAAQQRLEEIILPDIRAACDLFFPIFQRSRGDDGYVSLEVPPALAGDAAATVSEAARLATLVARPNLLIKIPGTAAGVQAFETLTAQGINVNVTLLFSVRQAVRVFEAYIRGLKARLTQGLPLGDGKAVASLFLSRIDTLADRWLETRGSPTALGLRGQLGPATAKLAYERYRELFHGAAFRELQDAGARPQYLLWASTGTKNPSYSDLHYVTPLMGAETINTLPDATLAALFDHGNPQATLDNSHNAARQSWLEAEKLGLLPDTVGATLQQEGLASFSDSYRQLLNLVA